MPAQAAGVRRWPLWPAFAASGLAACIVYICVSRYTHSHLQEISARLASRSMLQTGVSGPAGSSQQGCEGRVRLSAQALQARREYQAFLLEDAKQYAVPIVQWAGYNGPWIENTFRDHFERLFITGQDVGDRVYLPVMFFDCLMACSQEQKSELRGYLMRLKPEYKYFTFYFMDKGLVFSSMAFPRWLDLMVFSTGATMKGVRTVPMPNLKQVLQPVGLAQDINVNFLGDIKSHAVRLEMVTQLQSQGYLIAKAHNEDTFAVIERSNFTLAPRGHGSSSFRMYEALQLGSIPIYIWSYDILIPFQELLNWNEMAIVVHRQEIKFIPHLIKQFDVVRARALLAEHRQMWTYDYSHEYAIDRLRREHCFPVPVSTWSDMWGKD